MLLQGLATTLNVIDWGHTLDIAEKPDEYFKQLTSEELVTRYVRGVTKRVWKKKRLRNEAIDLRVYNLAALNILNPNFEVLKAKAEKTRKEKPKESTRTARPHRRRNFVTNY